MQKKRVDFIGDDHMDSVAVKTTAFFDSVFKEIHFSSPDIKKEYLENKAVMSVCSHRSQSDYFLLGMFLYRIGVKNVRFAAGDNLTNLPWLGKIFMELGAFPVSRDRARSRNYIKELSSEVADKISNGANVVVFPEGGRSYNGHMMDIRGGLIGAHVLSQWRSPEKDHIFIPATISYEQLPELLYFDMLEKGRELRKAKGNIIKKIIGNTYYFGADAIAFSKFFLSSKTKSNYGDVFIDFGEPFSVNDIVDLKKLYNKNSRDDFMAHRKAMQVIGIEIGKQFHKLYRILPMHVVASAIHDLDTKIMQRDKIIKAILFTMEKLHKDGNYNLKSVNNLNEADLVSVGMEQLRTMKGLRVNKKRVVIHKSSVIDYYASAIEK